MSSNPKHIGPGYWANWHSTSLVADREELKAIVARGIVFAVQNFPCKDPCKKDFTKYIKANPLLPAVKSKDPLSLFKWTVNAHNYVNHKLGKSIISWVEAKEMWEGKEGMCFENCGTSEDEIDNNKSSSLNNKSSSLNNKSSSLNNKSSSLKDDDTVEIIIKGF